MTPDELRQIYTEHERIRVRDPDGERFRLENRVRFVWHQHKTGIVLYSKLDETTVDDAIAEEIAFFKGLNYPFEWKLYDYDTPADSGERLLKNGFEKEELEAVMVLPIADAPENLRQPISYDIRLATHPEMFYDVDKVYYEVWKDDPYSDATPTRMSDWFLPRYENHPESMSMYVVYVDEIPVSYGRVEFTPDNPFGSIWGGSTLEAYRRRGIYTQLVAKRMQDAQSRGCKYLTVDARPDSSMPILEKLGFIRIAYARAYNRYPSPA